MGSFLDKPMTEKAVHEEVYKAGSMHIVSSSMQGYRISHEDAELCETGIDCDDDKSENCLFGVFDGHGGDRTAKVVSERFLNVFKECREKVMSDKTSNSSQALLKSSVEVIQASFESTMLELDRFLSQETEVRSGMDHSGTTAVVAFVSNTDIIVANVGDSRAVLCKYKNEPQMSSIESEVEVVAMSFDHKPYLQKERQRIMKAGGLVRMNRVNGDLAVARALGDFDYKTRDDLRPEEQMVSPFPDVKVVSRSSRDRFLVLACDGIWDVMENHVCVNFIADQIAHNVRLDLVANSLLDKCLELGSRDNMTVIIILFLENGKNEVAVSKKG
eukprot:g2012.t1